jgi:DNA repair protein RecO (recombination protein O)
VSINSTEALVIGSTNLVEADRIISVYSPLFGQIRGVAHGVKRIKNRFGSSLEPLTHIVLMFKEKPNRELQLIKQADIINSYKELREDITRLTAGLYVAELVQKLTPVGGDGQPFIFWLILKILDLLTEKSDIISILRIFEVRLLNLLGYKPNLECCLGCKSVNFGYNWGFSPSMGGVVCPGCRPRYRDVLSISPGGIKFLTQAMQMDLDKVGRLKIIPSNRDELEGVLQKTLLEHLGSSTKSYPILKGFL